MRRFIAPVSLALVADAKARIQQIDIEEYRGIVSSGRPHTLIDVREDHEWEAAHAAGAIHLSKGTIERDIETTAPRSATLLLVLYCGGGYRSALAVDSLQKMGYTHAISLDGGWRAIEASGLPLAK